MTVRDTSLMAYATVHLSKMQRIILRFITHCPNCCNAEIADEIGLKINSVTGRVKELRELELVFDAGKKKYHGRYVHIWTANKQLTL